MDILIVEDDAVFRNLVVTVLESLGHSVTTCRDAEEGLETFDRSPSPLLLLDWNLPGMSGIDLCRKLRQDHGTDLPVILMITARDNPGDLENALEAGADDFIYKPVDVRMFEARIRIAERAVTKRQVSRETRQLFKNSKMRLDHVVHAANIGIWDWNMETNHVYYSPEWKKQIGYEEHEISNDFQEWQSRLHPDDLEPILQKIKAYFENPWPDYQAEFRLQHKDGSYRWILTHASLLYDESGAPCRMVGSHIDITKIKQSEEQLSILTRAIEQNPASVMITDAKGAITYVNPGFTHMSGYSVDEALGKSPQLISSGETAQEQYKDLWNTIFSGNDWSGTMLNRRKSGEPYWVLESISPIKDAKGSITHFVAVQEDLTELKHMEDELRKSKDQAELANRAKSQFLASMSHELRTPLNAIIGFSQLLELQGSQMLPDDMCGEIDEIIRAGYQLLDLINEVLDLSHIESGHLDIQCEPVPLQPIISTAVSQIDVALATKHEITVTNQSDDMLLSVFGDKMRLKQVIMNLLSNAVKYNREGGSVIVKTRPLGDSHVCIEISDTGEGIPAQDIDKLFDPFERLTYKHGAVEGAGIGLTVTRQLVEAMDGSIGVDSIVGQGSTFWVKLKRANETADKPDATHESTHLLPAQVGRKRKILYIEDNPANTRLLMAALANHGGYEGLSSPTAEAGLTLAEQETPDIILMDLMLPGIDGYAALEILRKVESTRDIPVIAVSAKASDADIKKGRDAGFADYLTKPIDIEILFKKIDAYTAGTPHDSSA